MTMIDLDATIDMVVSTAQAFTCEGNHAEFTSAAGDPPAGYWEAISKLLAAHGYTVRKEPRAYLNKGNGDTVLKEGERSSNGVTTSPLAEVDGATVIIADDMNPAREFLVLAHEAAHVILDHPVLDDAQDRKEGFMRFMAEMFSGGLFKENPEHEIAAELAAVAVASAAGMEVSDVNLCYLAGRFYFFGAPDPATRRGRKLLKETRYATRMISNAVLAGQEAA